VPLSTPARIVSELASRGYNAEPEAVTRLAGAPASESALERALEAMPDDALKLTVDHVDSVLDRSESRADATSTPDQSAESGTSTATSVADATEPEDPSVSTGTESPNSPDVGDGVPVETKGVSRR